MELYVVRHGETDWNKNRLLQGRSDISLNKMGIQQAKDVKNKLENITFKKCYASPLIRARQTAEIITNNDLIIDDRLIERNFGKLEGKHNVSPDILDKQWDYKLDSKEYDIESLKEILGRVGEFKKNLLETNDSGNILIISHSATIKALHYNLIGYTIDTDFLDFKLRNGEISKYIIVDKKVKSFEIID